VGIPHEHRHVVDRADRRLLCACAACGLAFVDQTKGRFRSVPETVRAEASPSLGSADLRALGVPVGLAFFFRPSSLARWIGVFPSPAGPTEAELADTAWNALAAKSTLVRSIEDDVEALLVRCERSGDATVLVVPIDVCYELTALLRQSWRGIDGGDDARRVLDEFFVELAARASRAKREEAS
jgi:hypothetical protein